MPKMRGLTVDIERGLLVDQAVDAGFASVTWPVADGYEIISRTRLRDERVIRATGRERASWWSPGTTGLGDELAGLSVQSEDELLSWIGSHGLVGIAGDTRASEEVVEDIRDWTGHLALCRQLLAELRAERPVDELLEHARAAAGHLVDPDLVASIAGFNPGMAADKDFARPTARADLQVLHALGLALTRPLERLVRLHSAPLSRDGRLWIQPRIIGFGPLAIGYLETLAEASRLSIGWDVDEVRMDWRSPRRCQRCGRVFRPAKVDSRYCGKHCRWAASKAASRRAKTESEP